MKVPLQTIIGCAFEAERTITMSCDPVETRTIPESLDEEAVDKQERSNGDMTKLSITREIGNPTHNNAFTLWSALEQNVQIASARA
jgi:hypothetical protein